LLIAFSGNYTFFNLLTIVLCFVPLFDDGRPAQPGWSQWVVAPASVLLIEALGGGWDASQIPANP